MARPKKAADVVESVAEEFDPSALTLEQQEAVVKEYLGYHPKYFIFEGLAIRFNQSRFEADERTRAAEKDAAPREWFNGWKPKPSKYR